MIAALAGALLLALLPVPTLDGPVVDRAGVLSQPERARLDDLARAARATSGGKGPQLAFLIVPTLEGEPIESYSIRVAEKWKLGSKGRDDGLLFVLATGDREIRIEVGGGLEGALTDVQSGRIIREVMAPAFQQGGYGAGLRAGAEQALAHLGVDVGQARSQPGREEAPINPFLIFVALIVFWFVARWLGIPIRLGGPGGFGGMGGGGRRGGGGGYRGGGGGFSGGGASGRF